MIGTAPPSARLLLVEQPGPWGRQGLQESHADPAVALRIDHLAAAVGLRLQAIRRAGRHADDGGGHRVAVADVRPGVARTTWWAVDSLDTLVGQLESASTLDDGWLPDDAVIDREPLLLVCTHGRHDACCALRGRPLAVALQGLLPGRVWETTHVGGDRFAANLLALPSGALYGRVTPQAAPELVDRIVRGQVSPHFLRGWFGMSPIAQAGLAHAHRELSIPTNGALVVRRVSRVVDDRAEVTVSGPDGDATVGVVMSWSAPDRLTCLGPSNARARVYRAVSLTPAG
ncbi:sucrase ferredoxin [Allobranchiibius sp. CTAmp26]|uniref:sucrase ferredoxin n=1 Tax=Allobranchiibius sp. CTAmp26 TaxID=2815214 RepID=UPI001AA1C2AD|nr:sucrase ferredoxin [Allobranchiibius sp. CTAmp26]MBO1754502.1 sucrase ferredoxin [Allobranchiibius sp. CTAmp26]